MRLIEERVERVLMQQYNRYMDGPKTCPIRGGIMVPMHVR